MNYAECLDPGFIEYLLWHVPRCQFLIVILQVSQPKGPLQPYLFTPPYQQALFKMVQLECSNEMTGTRIIHHLTQNDEESGELVRQYSTTKSIPKTGHRYTYFLSMLPVLNPFSAELLLEAFGDKIFTTKLDQLMKIGMEWTTKERIVRLTDLENLV